MNPPTLLGAAIILIFVAAIIIKGIYNTKHRKSGCGCGCDACPSNGICHPKH